VRDEIWPVVQAAVAAGVAWFISYRLLGHPQPVFAPTAAVVSLAVGAGGRGRQAIQMLVGLGVGVAVGELLVLFLGTGTPQVMLAAAVALFFSQVLFTPSAVSLLKDEAGDVLTSISAGLDACADALLCDDADAAESALGRLRGEGAPALPELAAARDTGLKVSRRILRGRREMDRFERLVAWAARRLLDGGDVPPAWSVPAVRDLARAVDAFSKDPESPEAGRIARRSAREAGSRAVATGEARSHGMLLVEAVQLAASDILRIAPPGED
jgi:hypothetical protein